MESELERLRQENIVLRTRVNELVNEGAELAVRLAKVGGQEARVRGKEEQLSLLRQLADAEKRLQHALQERDKNLNKDSESPDKASTSEAIHFKQSNEMIECLQQELVKIRLREAESRAMERDLESRISELEQDNKTLRESAVDNSVAHLQEELIAVKLREAEANLSLKELKHRVSELSELWMKHLHEHRQESRSQSVSGVLSTPKKIMRAWENRTVDTQRLEEEIMSIRIRETEALAELDELKLKTMELETQVQVSTNQLRRQDEEKKMLKEELEMLQQRARKFRAEEKEQEKKYADLASKANHEKMLANLRFAECSQKIAELEQKLSVLRMKNHIIITEGKLKNISINNDDIIKQVQEAGDTIKD